MSNGNKEAKKEELLEKQEARKLTEEELEKVTGGVREHGSWKTGAITSFETWTEGQPQ